MKIDNSKTKSSFLLLLPLILISTTALVFYVSSNFLGGNLGYVIGFSFYYVFWCYGVTLAVMGKTGSLSSFEAALAALLFLF